MTTRRLPQIPSIPHDLPDDLRRVMLALKERNEIAHGERPNQNTGDALLTHDEILALRSQGIVQTSQGIVQTVADFDSSVATGTTVIPPDATIPQITEGDEYLSVAITPKSANNYIEIDVTVQGSTNHNSAHDVAALFVAGTANALAAAAARADNTYSMVFQFSYRALAGSTSARTYSVRAGPGTAATFTFNGQNGAAALGGVMMSSLVVREVAP